MNSTLWKDLYREIKQSLPRFLSIIIIIALGVAFFIGIRSAGPSLIATTQAYYLENHLPHGEVIGTYGLDSKDIAKLNTIDLRWLPMKTVKAKLITGDHSAKIYSLPENKEENFFKVVKGRLPESQAEIVLDSQFLTYLNPNSKTPINLGDQVEISQHSVENDDAPHLMHTHFKVVGFVETPIYFERTSRGNEAIDVFAVVGSDEIQGDLYTEAFFWKKDLENSHAFQSDWEKELEEVKLELENLLKDQGEVRLSALTKEVEKELAKGEGEIEEGYSALESGRQEIEDIQSQLESASQTLEKGKEDWMSGSIKLDDGVSAYNSGLIDYNSGVQLLNDNENLLLAYQTSYDEGLAQYNQGFALLNGGMMSIEQDLLLAESVVESGNAELADARSMLESGESQLILGRQLGESLLSEFLPEGIVTVDDIQSLLNQYPQEISSLEEYLETISPNIISLQEFNPQNQTDPTSLGEAVSPIDELLIRIDELENYRQTLSTQLEEMMMTYEYPDETPSEDAVVDESDIDELLIEITDLDNKLLALYQEVGQLQDENVTESSEKSSTEPENNLSENGINLEDYQSLLNLLNSLQVEYDTLEKAWQTYGQDLTEIMTAESRLEAGWESYNQGLADLEAASLRINDGWMLLENLRNFTPNDLLVAQERLANAKTQLDEGWARLESGKLDLEAASLELTQASNAIVQGQKDLTAGSESLTSATDKYQQGVKDYESGSRAFDQSAEEAKKNLVSAQNEIDQARQELKKLLTPQYIVNLAQENEIYQGLENNASQLNVISNIFPVFFLLIAVLVTYSTIKRMTFEQRNFMGTLKQLGYPDKSIISKFGVYSGVAAFVGILLGIVVGYLVFPPVVLAAYNIMYLFDHPVVSYSLPWMIVITLIALATALVPAIGSPARILTDVPAKLLKPPPPRAGKKILLERISWLWQKFSFKQKMTIRNLFRYLGRNMMTLFGVAGCTMLIVTGYGISDTISGIVDRQFNQIQTFDSMLILKEKVDTLEVDKLASELAKSPYIKDFIPIHQATIETNRDGIANQTVNVIVPTGDRKTFAKYIDLHEREFPDQPLSLSPGQLFISERLEEFVDTKVHKTMDVIYDNVERTIPVSQVVENYTLHYLYISPEDFEKYFFDKPTTNLFYLEYESGGQEIINESLATNPNVLTVFNIEEVASGVKNSLGSLDLITLVLIISAAGLAFVVLFNLTNINIEERMKELATIKVLGFYSYEVSLYIYDEVLVLTFVGALLGLLFGKILTHFIMKTMQLSTVLFYPTIHLKSYLISFALTFIFSAIVMFVMHRKIKAIDMVEALKAVE